MGFRISLIIALFAVLWLGLVPPWKARFPGFALSDSLTLPEESRSIGHWFILDRPDLSLDYSRVEAMPAIHAKIEAELERRAELAVERQQRLVRSEQESKTAEGANLGTTPSSTGRTDSETRDAWTRVMAEQRVPLEWDKVVSRRDGQMRINSAHTPEERRRKQRNGTWQEARLDFSGTPSWLRDVNNKVQNRLAERHPTEVEIDLALLATLALAVLSGGSLLCCAALLAPVRRRGVPGNPKVR